MNETVEKDPVLEVEEIINSFCSADKCGAYKLIEAVKKPRKRRKALPKEGQENWVTLRSLFKTVRVPESVGNVVEEAIKVLLVSGDITETNRFQALEYMAAEFLASHGAAEDGDAVAGE